MDSKIKEQLSALWQATRRTLGFAILHLLKVTAQIKARLQPACARVGAASHTIWKKAQRQTLLLVGSAVLWLLESTETIREKLAVRYAGRYTKINRVFRYTGLQAMRKGRMGLRWIKQGAFSAKTATLQVWAGFVRSFKVFAAKNGIDLYAKQQAFEEVRNEIAHASSKGFGALLAHLIKLSFTSLCKAISWLFGSVNYIAPILAACCFAVVVHVTLNMTFALEVRYNGETIGYISDESVFDTAEKEVLKRIVFEDYIRPDDTLPQFSITAVKDDQITNEYDLTNQIIKASGNELSEATGLYIDEKFMGAVTEGDNLIYLLDAIKNRYATGDENETVEFVKEVLPVEGLYPVTSLVDIALLEDELSKEESQQRVYRTVAGDAPLSIAKKNGIPYSQLKALNPEIETKLLIGQEILVEKAVPLLEVKMTRTEISEEDEGFKIEQVQDTSKYQGYVETVQKGKKGLREVTSQVTYIDGIETAREILSSRLVEEPVNEKVVVGGKTPLAAAPASGGKASTHFRWPADGGYVTAAYGSAGYYGHTGMDIGGLPAGSPVRASASGTVVKVRYDTWNYGYHIMVDHGAGVQTLYAHNSKIYVKVGDWVEQGQLIAGIGRTGRATGNHVHFEIRLNGRYVNPAQYIGGKSPY